MDRRCPGIAEFERLSILSADAVLSKGYKLSPMVDMLCFDTERQPRRRIDGKGLPHDETTQNSEYLRSHAQC